MLQSITRVIMLQLFVTGMLSKANTRIFVSSLSLSSLSSFKTATTTTTPTTRLYSSSTSANTSDENENSIEDSHDFSEYENKKNRDDQIFSALSEDGGVKVTVCTVRNLVNDVMIQNTMAAIPAEALGRTMICALLMSSGMQEEQMLQISIKSDGPIRGVVGIAKSNGDVRGYVGTPMLGGDDPTTTLKDAIGTEGSIQVVKNHPSWPRPYNGITPIKHFDVDRDIGIYLASSEQRACALAASTSITGILCTAAGGYLIEQLPDADSETIAKVEQNLATLVEKNGSGENLPTGLLAQGISPVEIASIVLDGCNMQPLEQIKPRLFCECTPDRLVRSLKLLPRSEIEDIFLKQETLEARCEFCAKVYTMSPEEVRQELDKQDEDADEDS